MGGPGPGLPASLLPLCQQEARQPGRSGAPGIRADWAPFWVSHHTTAALLAPFGQDWGPLLPPGAAPHGLRVSPGGWGAGTSDPRGWH